MVRIASLQIWIQIPALNKVEMESELMPSPLTSASQLTYSTAIIGADQNQEEHCGMSPGTQVRLRPFIYAIEQLVDHN